MNYALLFIFFFFFNDTATTEIYTLSLHDALPILFEKSIPVGPSVPFIAKVAALNFSLGFAARSEEHTSELQSQSNLVCRLLLEKKYIESTPHTTFRKTLGTEFSFHRVRST